MRESCCELGAKLLDEGQVLYQTDNFFVAPTIGPIGIEGYLLIMPKECYKGVGSIPLGLHTELREVLVKTKSVLSREYGLDSFMFEHGPRLGSYSGGRCIDHAHIHLVPGVDVFSDVLSDLPNRSIDTRQSFKFQPSEDFSPATEITSKRESSYLMIESSSGKLVFLELKFNLPGQYIRRLIAKSKESEEWDYSLYPQHELVKRTIERLKGKFD